MHQEKETARVRDLRRQLAEAEAALPAHSATWQQVRRVEDLEEDLRLALAGSEAAES